jgi:tetratricopeptide (TPR) repeat protein
MPEPGNGVTPACLDDDTLAAFVDGRLSPDERAQVESHVAECDDCYTLLAEVLHTADDLEAELPNTSNQRAPSAASVINLPTAAEPAVQQRKALVAAGVFLALAASAILFLSRPADPLAPMVEIVGAERLTIARPTGGFAFGPVRSPLRSGNAPERLDVQAEETRLREKAERGTTSDVHAYGVAQLVAGRTAAAIRTLEAAAAAAPNVASYHADAGAAYLTRYFEQRDARDAATALASLDRAIALDRSCREALFNRALLLGALGRPAEAIDNWSRYLAVDGDSPWAAEARRQRDALKRP